MSRRSWWAIILLLLSPILLGLVIPTLDTMIPDEKAKLQALAILFSSIAVLAVSVTGVLVRFAVSRYLFARRNYAPDSNERLRAVGNLVLLGGLLVAHLIFLAVGISNLILPLESIWRIELGRIGLIEVQYILLVIGIVFYIFTKQIHRNTERAIESETLREKMDEAAEVATVRHIQYTDEHIRILRQTRDAAIKAAELAEIEGEKIDSILEKLRRE